VADQKEKLQLIIEAVNKASGTLDKINTSMTGMSQGFFKTATGASFLGNVLSNVATKAFNVFKNAIVDGIKDAIEAEQAEVRLAQALRNSGQEVTNNVSSLKLLAAQLQQTTTFEDDAMMSAMALGLQLGLTTKQIEKLMPAVTDMAAALGMDLEGAMRMVARGATGSGGTLSRWGISIKEAGTEAEKLDAIVTQLNAKFGGQAQALANTTGGTLEQLGVAFGNLKEKIGTTVIQSDLFQAAMGTVRSAVEFVNQALSQQEVWDNFVYNLEQAARKAKGLAYEFKGLITPVDETAKLQAELAKETEAATRAAMGQVNIAKLSNSQFQELISNSEAFALLTEEQIKLVGERLDAEIKAGEKELEIVQKQSDGRVRDAETRQKQKELLVTFLIEQEKRLAAETGATWTAMSDEQIATALRVQEVIKFGSVEIADFAKFKLQEIQQFALGVTQAFTDSLAQGIYLWVSGTGKNLHIAKAMWEDFSMSVLRMLTQLIAKLIVYRMLSAAVSFGIPGAGGLLSMFRGFQTHVGQSRVIPGPPGMPMPIIAHGQEIIGRSSLSANGGLNVTVLGDVYGWDESIERLRSGLYNHQRITGLSPVVG
jgi:hypothetical protein